MVVSVGALTLAGARAGLGSGSVRVSRCQGEYQVPYPQPPPVPPAHSAAARLQRLIGEVPCPYSGRVSFDARDDRGDSMSALDPIPAPDQGYLGVYHSAFRPPHGPLAVFRISLARSSDLIHWTRVRILDGSGASMPTLRTIPGSSGYLLAYEKALRGGNVVRVRYYASAAALLAGRFSAQRDLPRVFSPYNNGTPTVLWVRWNGGLSRSVIGLGFHYETAPSGARGPDREAIGTLRGFRTWSAWTEAEVDSAIDRRGLRGSHGDWRQFYFGRSRWRLYEAQTVFNDFGTWRVLLENPASRRTYPVSLTMGGARVSSSFANPIARVEPAPAGGGRVLVITMFLFEARGAEPGELVYYQPI